MRKTMIIQDNDDLKAVNKELDDGWVVVDTQRIDSYDDSNKTIYVTLEKKKKS